jgi:fibro-slime domain-containing protein
MQYLYIFIICGFYTAGHALSLDTTADTSNASDTPPEFWLPITIFDFHTDLSCPAFEMKGAPAYVSKGLVQQQLGPDNVPLPITEPDERQAIHRAEHVDKWFLPWTPGDTLVEIFPAETTVTFDKDFNMLETVTPADTIRTDTMYINIELKDSIPFYRHTTLDTLYGRSPVDTFQIEYDEYGNPETTFTSMDVPSQYILEPDQNRYIFNNQQFFPIDNRGFDPDGLIGETSDINYGFTMVLSNSFTYQGGEELYIAGDDDIWVFIDNTLAMDIGGLHITSSEYLELDNLGLTPGQRYRFDLFFAERHSSGSSLKIITDIQFAGEIVDPDTNDVNDTIAASSKKTGEDSGSGLCGNGAVLAFLPMICIGIGQLARRKSSRIG